MSAKALRMQRYEEAVRLHAEVGWGAKRISQKLKVPLGTIDNWIYKGVIPNRKPKPWNKGLSKETDPRIKKWAESRKGCEPWNKGKEGCFSEEARMKMRLAQLGRKVPKEVVQKIADANRGKKRSADTKRRLSEANKGQIPWNKGKTNVYSEEHLKLLSDLATERAKKEGNNFGNSHTVSDEVRKRIAEKLKGHTVSEETKAKIREKRLKQIFPLKDTSIEVAIQNELDRLELVYQKHLGVCGICQPDIVFPKRKIAVFCDGDYWHNLPHIIEKDRWQNQILSENGWAVFRFWEHEIKEDPRKCVVAILEHISSMRRDVRTWEVG